MSLVRRSIFALAFLLTLTARGQADDRDKLAASARYTATWTYDVTARANTERFRFTLTLPRTIPNRQTVHAINFTPQPTRREFDGGNEYAIWDIRNPQPSSQIVVKADVEVFRADLPTLTAKAKANGVGPQPKSFDRWLGHEKFIECDAESVQAAAARIVGETDLSLVRGIHEFVLRRLKSGTFNGDDRGAVWALENRTGDCSEFSDLFVAMCRARKIPAFVVEGFVTTTVKENDTPKHSWVEAYIDGVGWVPFDLFHSTDGSAAFDRLAPTRILTSVRRNDPKLDGYHHWQYRYWGEPVEITDTYSVVNSAK